MDGSTLATTIAGFDPAPHIAEMNGRGWTVIENFLDEDRLAAFRAAIAHNLTAWQAAQPVLRHVVNRVEKARFVGPGGQVHVTRLRDRHRDKSM